MSDDVKPYTMEDTHSCPVPGNCRVCATTKALAEARAEVERLRAEVKDQEDWCRGLHINRVATLEAHRDREQARAEKVEALLAKCVEALECIADNSEEDGSIYAIARDALATVKGGG